MNPRSTDCEADALTTTPSCLPTSRNLGILRLQSLEIRKTKSGNNGYNHFVAKETETQKVFDRPKLN